MAAPRRLWQRHARCIRLGGAALVATAPGAALLLRQCAHLVPLEVARQRQDQVVGGVAARGVLAHLLHRQRADALLRPQHVVAQRMAREIRLHQAAVGLACRHILRTRDLFEDDVALQREISCIESGAHHIAEQVDGLGQILAQDTRIVDCLLDRGEGVELGAHLVEVKRDLLGVAVLRALEDHVFEEV